MKLGPEKWNAGPAVLQASAKTHSCLSTELLGSSWRSELSIHRSQPFRRSLRGATCIWNDSHLPFPSQWWLQEGVAFRVRKYFFIPLDHFCLNSDILLLCDESWNGLKLIPLSHESYCLRVDRSMTEGQLRSPSVKHVSDNVTHKSKLWWLAVESKRQTLMQFHFKALLHRYCC